MAQPKQHPYQASARGEIDAAAWAAVERRLPSTGEYAGLKIGAGGYMGRGCWAGAAEVLHEQAMAVKRAEAEAEAAGLKAKATPELGENPKDRLGIDKTNLALVPTSALIYAAEVMRLGAAKYGAYNWRDNAVKRTVYLEAAMRHILQALDGEDADAESGMPHEAHALSCLAILLDAMANDKLVDDRPRKGSASALMARLKTMRPLARNCVGTRDIAPPL